MIVERATSKWWFWVGVIAIWLTWLLADHVFGPFPQWVIWMGLFLTGCLFGHWAQTIVGMGERGNTREDKP